jgi:hypothetical protein
MWHKLNAFNGKTSSFIIIYIFKIYIACALLKSKKSTFVTANSCQNPVVVSDVLRGGLIPGGQTSFYQPTNSTLQAVQQQAPSAQQLHQTGSPYTLQGYGTQSGGATPVGLQNFGSQVMKY